MDADKEEAFAAALEQLESTLAAAMEIRERRDFKSFNPDRLAAVAALNGCIGFIQSCQQWKARDLGRPLTHLASALLDLDTNHIDPMLRPIKNGKGGRPTSFTDDTMKGFAAGIMGGLMLPGPGQMSENAAARWVAKRLQSTGYSEAKAATIRNWRKDALEDPQSTKGGRYRAALSADWSNRNQCAMMLIHHLDKQHLVPKKPRKVENPPG